ncbi:MAG: alpha/beta hydrolase [Bacteroidota bacterium]
MHNLLLLHGALGSRSQFDSFVPLLGDTFNVHTLNFSGHGGNVMPAAGYSFDTFAGDILKYIDGHGIARINIFGYSMGGYAALYFAKKHPERVERIMTLNTKFNWDPLATAKETAMLNAEKMLEKVPAFANNLMLQHGMNIWKQVLQNTETMMNNLASHVTLTDDDLQAINCPVVIGVSDRDTTATIDENLDVYKKLPKAHFMVFPNTPHPFEKVNHEALALQCNLFFNTK